MVEVEIVHGKAEGPDVGPVVADVDGALEADGTTDEGDAAHGRDRGTGGVVVRRRDDGGVRWVLGIVAGVALTWLVMLVALALARPEGTTLADAARLLPDLVGLVQRLARDPEVPRGARVTLWLLAGYLVFPVDLVPDFLPVIGYADDAIVVAVALRRVVRVAGPAALERHWRGSDGGMAIVRRLAGI